MFLKDEFSNRLFQVSLFASIVYYITANPIVFEKVREYFPIKFKNTQTILIFQTFVFAVLMYILTYFVFDPLMKVVEGYKPAGPGEECDPIQRYPCQKAEDGKQVLKCQENSGMYVCES